MARVLVAMSGGVDSSVAAAMLRDAGHDVTGVTLKLWGGPQDSGCCSASDVEDARRVAAQLDIPHYVFNFSEDFEARVVAPYVTSYSQGLTPNPCVSCNQNMKWGRLFERAAQLGFDLLATGHHARLGATPTGPRIARGTDAAKDQSYVLYMLSDDQLRRTVLPVGEITKAEVRARARTLDLRTAEKSESMDVCFITKGGREAFIDARVAPTRGTFVDTAGTPVGEHRGVAHFTIGQRRGLGVATGERNFVIDLDASTQTVTLGSRHDLLRDSVWLTDLVFADGRSPQRDAALLAQSRAHGDAVACRLDSDVVRFVTPQPRVAPGQVVALYDGDWLLGGGIAAA